MTRGDGLQRLIDGKTGTRVFDIMADKIYTNPNTPGYIRSMVNRGESIETIFETATTMKNLATKDAVEAYQSALYYAPKGAKINIVDDLVDTAGNRIAGKVDETGAVFLDKALATKQVAMHEVTHAYISRMPEARRAAMFAQAEKQYGTKNLVDLEEAIADELFSYSAQKTMRTTSLSGKVKEAVLDLYNKLEGFVGKDQKLKTLYDDIIAGKQYTAVTRSGEFYKRVSQSERIK